MGTSNPCKQRKSHTIWGSGLLAVDVVMRSKETDAFEITAGGTCANVLANLSHLGWEAAAKGRVGNDPAGRILEEHLIERGVDVSSLILDEHVETPVMIERFGLGDHSTPSHRFEWKCPKCSSPVPRYRATPIRMLEIEEQSAFLPLLFFFDRPTPGNLRLASFLKQLGVIIVFEPPRLKDEPAYKAASGLADVLKFAETKALPCLESWQVECSLVIVTKGASGLSYQASDFYGLTTDWIEMPAFHISHTLDACGSGDWLTAGLLHAFFAVDDFTCDISRRLVGALKFGQVLASLNCLLPGARGLSRIYERAEIGEMAALALAEGLSSLESKIIERASELGKFREIELICSACIRLSTTR